MKARIIEEKSFVNLNLNVVSDIAEEESCFVQNKV